MPRPSRKPNTAAQHSIRKRLASPDVDEDFAAEHIARECEMIQAGWTDAQKRRAASETDEPIVLVEITAGDYWRNGVPCRK